MYELAETICANKPRLYVQIGRDHMDNYSEIMCKNTPRAYVKVRQDRVCKCAETICTNTPKSCTITPKPYVQT